jgi:hypothetical protein
MHNCKNSDAVPGAVYVMRNAARAYISEAVLFGEAFYFYYGAHLLIFF